MAILSKDDSLVQPHLDKPRHIKYWTRCLKTFLPHQYTGNDSNRMYLAYFIISALDLLGALKTVPSEQERQDHINWVYRCQHPNGGFRMWPGTDFGELSNESNAPYDPANIPGTYFALATLLIYGDDLSRVQRKDCLKWLQRMQRSDGSFGETLVKGQIEGGSDSRLGFCAAGDIDLDGFVKCVQMSESFDGGIADEPFHEPQAGYTFCSLGALALIGRLNRPDSHDSGSPRAPVDPLRVLDWLVWRQTELTDPDAELDTDFHTSGAAPDHQHAEGKHITKGAMSPDGLPAKQSPEKTVGGSIFDLLVDGAGMNGRTNKVADTCYAFWAGASLHILEAPSLCDQSAIRRYLLGKTQHGVLGGFGKFPGDLPDLYHSYLGLAALSLAGSDELKPLDGGMCLSKETRERLPAIWRSWQVEVD
ncbi:geranylgeranyl transferase-like protein type i beta subunit [Hortaea werneckii]|nr:geranylgeranyl transferase-like protein type i beta subunit [Hortaea werneckii]KAI7709367.1 geranylgeranyl transferase-like protein type i beta subunit [Hortaea werneckii]